MTEPDWTSLLSTFDMFDPAHEEWKYEGFAYAREHCPIIHGSPPSTGPRTIVTRYADVRQVLEDPETFSSAGSPPIPAPIRLGALDADPPEHTAFRRLLNPVFTRQFSLQFEPEMRVYARELIDTWIDKGEVDILAEFASPYVARILARMVFDETDMAKMERAKQVVVRVAEHPDDEGFFDLAVLSAEYLAAAIDSPPERDGMLRQLVTGEFLDGKPMSEEQAMGAIASTFLGGLDTSRSAIAGICLLMAQRPELEARVRDPRWIRNDMDEFVRLISPVASLGRIATRDTEVGGCPVKQGEHLLLRFDSANRDEAKFPNADQLQFDPPRTGTAGFGLGIHRCIGMHLARVQMAVAMEEVLARITNLRLAVPVDEVTWAPGIANCPHAVPLVFDRVTEE
jgi:cytochrome P450